MVECNMAYTFYIFIKVYVFQSENATEKVQTLPSNRPIDSVCGMDLF